MTNSYERNLEIARKFAHTSPLGSLPEKVLPVHAALVVIDMQNDFCAVGSMVSKGGRDVAGVGNMAERLPGLIDSARHAGLLVIFVRSILSSDRNNYLSDVWIEQAARKQGGGYTDFSVCSEGSWEADYYEKVRPQEGDVVVTKHRYSAFYNTDLDTILRANGIRTVVLSGVSTNVCVETAARDAFNRDYYVVVVGDGSAAYSTEEHEGTLKNIDRFFGEITSIQDLDAIWSLRNARQEEEQNLQ